MMNTEIKAKWVAALRSGEYQQGEGMLKDGTAFCCLGVLCDLAAREGVGAWEKDSSYFTSGEERELSVTTRAVVEWAGLPSRNPSIRTDVRTDSLAGLNDDGVTFEEIADLIEAQL